MNDHKGGKTKRRHKREQARKKKIARSPDVLETAAFAQAPAGVDVTSAVSGSFVVSPLVSAAQPLAVALPLALAAERETRADIASHAVDAAGHVEADPKIVTARLADPDRDKSFDIASGASVVAFRTLARTAEYWMKEQNRIAQAQAAWSGQMIDFWSNTLRRFAGVTDAPSVPHENDKVDMTTKEKLP